MPLRVSIIEDDAPLREILADLIARTPDMLCVSQHPNGEHALQQLPAAAPEVALVDIEMPRLNGIECVRRLRATLPGLLPVMLTKFGDDDQLFEALRAGAVGYLLKRGTADELRDALRLVAAGGSPMTAELTRRVLRHFHRPPPAAPPELATLSVREREIFQHIAQGLTSKEIAALLGISSHTVDHHVRHVCVKLRTAEPNAQPSDRRAIARRLFPSR